MDSISYKQEQLIGKLKELFMMDQADLDFGIYRVMNAKHDEIDQFLHKDLLPTIRSTLQQGGKSSDAQKELKQLQKTLSNAGMNPDDSPKVQELKELLGDGTGSSLEKDEEEIFSHLYTFFSRYYEGGDFMSLRRYRKETYSPLAMNGEEVKLHWANADQYYIKSAENFSHYTFKVGEKKIPVRFEVVAASTEQNNNKADNDKNRCFILDENKPLEVRQEGETEALVIHFNYQADAKKRKQKELNTATVSFLTQLKSSHSMVSTVFENSTDWDNWQSALLILAPTEKNKKRTTLEKHLTDYTAKNSFDYFIHKDLGGFLHRELDFFIKNELLLLDDIIPDDANTLSSQALSNERSLKKIIAFKAIAQKIIAFLAQLENFQKKLWLKKKFVLEAQYSMTLDRVPEAFYAEIIKNQEQIQEWVDLGFTTEDSEITEDYLKQNPYLLIDTGLFDKDFKQRLLAEIEDLDETTDGLLLHSENFQALNLIQERYREQVKCIYIDPPYNTGNDGFAYKDSYQHSSWISMLNDRTEIALRLGNKQMSFFSSIDDSEAARLRQLYDAKFGEQNFTGNIIWQKKYAPQNDAKWFSDDHDFIISYALNKDIWRPKKLPRTEKQNKAYKNLDSDKRGRWKSSDYKSNKSSTERPNLYYPIINPNTDEEVWPNKNAVWRYTKEQHLKNQQEGRVWWGDDGANSTPSFKRFLTDVGGLVPRTLWFYDEVGHNQDGIRQIRSLLPETSFTSPKPVALISKIIRLAHPEIILDYFAGSGTTAHATINLNREDQGNRKYILVEVGNYFNTVLKPRIKKVVHSENWKNGKPVADKEGNYNGISHCFKTLRLESYEDTLDNLQLKRSQQQAELLNNLDNKTLKKDYLLNYMLNVETKGSLYSPDLFIDPFNAKIRVTRDNESKQQSLDLVETFNYLLGLRVKTIRKQQDIVEIIGKNPANQSILIIWRVLTETDNDALDNWFQKQSYHTQELEFDLIYVNGDNNLATLRTSAESWKVQLIEEVFQTLMFDEGAI